MLSVNLGVLVDVLVTMMNEMAEDESVVSGLVGDGIDGMVDVCVVSEMLSLEASAPDVAVVVVTAAATAASQTSIVVLVLPQP